MQVIIITQEIIVICIWKDFRISLISCKLVPAQHKEHENGLAFSCIQNTYTVQVQRKLLYA